MTAAIAKKQVREAKGELVGGNEVQAAAFEAFMDMHSLNDLIEAPDAGESFIYAACLLYPDLVKMLIQKVAKQNLNSDLKKSYFTGYQSSKWVDMLEHSLFYELEDEPVAYPWLIKAQNSADT